MLDSLNTRKIVVFKDNTNHEITFIYNDIINRNYHKSKVFLNINFSHDLRYLLWAISPNKIDISK